MLPDWVENLGYFYFCLAIKIFDLNLLFLFYKVLENVANGNFFNTRADYVKFRGPENLCLVLTVIIHIIYYCVSGHGNTVFMKKL